MSTIHKIDNEHIEYKDSQEKLEQLEYTESGVFSKSEKTLETKTVESELEFRTLFDHSYDAIFLIRDFVIIDSNKKTLNLFGYTKEEIVGKSPMYLSPTIQPDGSDSYKKGMQKMNDTLKGIPQFFEWTHTKKSGTNFDAEISLNRIVIDKETYVQAIVRDITEQKKTKDMLLLTQFTIDHASESIFWIRSDGGIMYTNEASIELLGYSHEEYKSMAIYDIDHDFNIEKSAEIWRRAKKDGHFRFESRYCKKNGELLPVEVTANYVKYQDKHIVACFVRDITKQKLAETEKRRMEEERLKMNKLESIGMLAGGIAHDFNNILTTILGNISLAKIYLKNDIKKVDAKINEAEKALFRARDLTQQLLTFSRGGVPVKKTILLEPLIKESVLFALRGSSVQVNFNISEDIFPTDVDEGMIGQAINNLIINAVQAMPDGGSIDVAVDNIILENKTTIEGLQLEKGSYVKITIKDHGIGISNEHIAKIFDPYFTTKEKRTGLGLATTFSIIQKHGGHITVNSELGIGTIFNIYLVASPEHITINRKTNKPVYGQGKILIMDDDEDILNIAGEMLSTLGYEVEYAKNGVEAIDKYKKMLEQNNPFDLVIMDLTIPGGMGGKDAIKGLLALDRHVKAIVSSGYSDDPIMGNHTEYGFVGVALKPYKLNELSEIVQKAIKQKPSLPIRSKII
ncbi:MAG TPA: PAS domain S-box protein [Syntrophorhabdaceae bacterium]|nr:PAS domain S-box protein [Syntrophorhabdaceae bacterium]HPN98790.1 PAS domain S-box protein [Syntrophorhabdaceae bacterium]HQG51788.1 PAS domain S-box protein [Syntrophorhabdaceae bacterium]HQI57310.1 PAS domain S-box protein [Syntrophorhabdaceae bacterium]